jgi:hypothetical protein
VLAAIEGNLERNADKLMPFSLKILSSKTLSCHRVVASSLRVCVQRQFLGKISRRPIVASKILRPKLSSLKNRIEKYANLGGG